MTDSKDPLAGRKVALKGWLQRAETGELVSFAVEPWGERVFHKLASRMILEGSPRRCRVRKGQSIARYLTDETALANLLFDPAEKTEAPQPRPLSELPIDTKEPDETRVPPPPPLPEPTTPVVVQPIAKRSGKTSKPATPKAVAPPLQEPVPSPQIDEPQPSAEVIVVENLVYMRTTLDQVRDLLKELVQLWQR